MPQLRFYTAGPFLCGPAFHLSFAWASLSLGEAQGHCMFSSCCLKCSCHQGPLSMGFSRQEHWSGLPHRLLSSTRAPQPQVKTPFFFPSYPNSSHSWLLSIKFSFNCGLQGFMVAPWLPWWLRGKESTCDAGDAGDVDSIPAAPFFSPRNRCLRRLRLISQFTRLSAGS